MLIGVPDGLPVCPVHGGADGPCPAVREFTLRAALNLAFGDLPWVGGIIPAVDRPKFPPQRALLTTGDTYAFKLQACKGNDCGAFSNVADVTAP